MRVFVTGGTGFTGAALVERLLADGHEVTVLDTKRGLVLSELERRGAKVALGSVTDPQAVAASCEGAEVVMHLAAAFRETGAPDELYRQVNVEGTRIVVEAAKRAGARKLVYCSTQGVHGHIDDPPGDETSPIRPEDYYQQTKYEGEQEVRRHAEGLEWVTLRPTAIYGPGDPERFAMIFRRVARGTFPMFGDGTTYYHPLYIDNMVDAFVIAAAPGVGAGEAYIIADEQFVSIEQLVKRVARAIDVEVRIPHYPLLPLIAAGHVCEKLCKPFGINPPIFPRRVDWYRQVRAFRIDKARRDLGYQPRVGLDEGLRRSGQWYREQGIIPAA